MNVLTNTSSVALWQEALRDAQEACSMTLSMELEAYLVYLLIKYTSNTNIAKRIIAMQFLESLQLPNKQREIALQAVGDQCLLLVGLFPHRAQKRLVKINYFVTLGRSAYSSISKNDADLPGRLAEQFVTLMDILQSIRSHTTLSPLEAYEQWCDVNSQRALTILQGYTRTQPFSVIQQQYKNLHS